MRDPDEKRDAWANGDVDHWRAPQPTPVSNAVRCKKSGKGIAMKLGGGWCLCESPEKCAIK